MGTTSWSQPKTETDPTDGNPVGTQQVRVINTTSTPKPLSHFDRAVDDCTLLLMFAAETGKNVDDATRISVLRASIGAGPDDAVAASLLSAYTKLAAELSPVTAASLRASCGDQAKPTIKSLRRWTCILAVPIILFSLLAFVSSSIAGDIRTDITTANELAVKLRAELGTATAPTAGTPAQPELPKGLSEADVIAQLQLYASTIRAIDARARQLNWFVFNAEWDPLAALRWKASLSEKQNTDNQQTLKQKFQLPVGLPNMPLTLETLTGTYQDVRSFAQNILNLVSVCYGAITACLLPVLYALLGTCAYLLRVFEEELKARTFLPSSRANWARFLIAGIGGAVVGLFGNFNITQGASIFRPWQSLFWWDMQWTYFSPSWRVCSKP